MKPYKLCFAPREIFDQILLYAVIPTFDLVVWCEGRGLILLRRRIAPYKNTWALPGLRMMKPESIDDTLARIARSEIGVAIDPASKKFIGQYVGRFRTEFNRQDLSTCYALSCDSPYIKINREHFSGHCFIKAKKEIPANIGAMYQHYLHLYFQQNQDITNQTEGELQ